MQPKAIASIFFLRSGSSDSCRILSIFLLFLVIVAASGYIFFAPATAFDEKTKSFVIGKDKTDKDEVSDLLQQKDIIKNQEW